MQPGTPAPERAPCSFFLRGFCKNGADCAWRHPAPEEEQRFACLPDCPPGKFRSVPCRHFTRGRCPHGDLCTFAHVRLAPAVDAAEPRTRRHKRATDPCPAGKFRTRACAHFAAGLCKRGATCTFVH